MTNLSKRIAQAKTDGKYIQTARLFLIPLDVSDAEQAFKWCGDKEVTRFMNYTTYRNVEDVAKWIAESGHNCFGFFLRENGLLIGSGNVAVNKSGIHELGYNLARAYWGKGYCTQASKALLAYRAAQGVTDFKCEHAKQNLRSERVIQKCGFVYRKDGSYTAFDGQRTFESKEYTLHINSHQMNVDKQWFDKIVSEHKTIELRLYDEKRRKIRENDYIILNNLDTNGDLTKCVVQVKNMYKFADFYQLYNNLDMTKCGYLQTDVPDSKDMLQYYSYERQAEFGVVGIEFELLCAM